jgi:hypothetical protein
MFLPVSSDKLAAKMGNGNHLQRHAFNKASGRKN